MAWRADSSSGIKTAFAPRASLHRASFSMLPLPSNVGFHGAQSMKLKLASKAAKWKKMAI